MVLSLLGVIVPSRGCAVDISDIYIHSLYMGICECRWRRQCASTSKLASIGVGVHSVVYTHVDTFLPQKDRHFVW